MTRTAASHSTLRLLDSKTDLFSEGCNVVLPLIGDKFCPVTAIEAAMADAPVSLAAPIFQAVDGRPVSYTAFSVSLARLVAIAKLTHLCTRPQSFRTGVATTAALLGFPASRFKVLGRWQCVSAGYPAATRARGRGSIHHVRFCRVYTLPGLWSNRSQACFGCQLLQPGSCLHILRTPGPVGLSRDRSVLRSRPLALRV